MQGVRKQCRAIITEIDDRDGTTRPRLSTWSLRTAEFSRRRARHQHPPSNDAANILLVANLKDLA